MKTLVLLTVILFATSVSNAQIGSDGHLKPSVTAKMSKLDTIRLGNAWIYPDGNGNLVLQDTTGIHPLTDFLSAVFGQDSLARLQNQPAKTLYVSPSFVAPLTNPYFSSLRSAAAAVNGTSGYTIQLIGVDTTMGTIIFDNADSLTIIGYGAQRYLPPSADGAITMLRFKDCDHLQLLGFSLDGRASTRTGTYGSGGNSRNGILIETVSQDSSRDILIRDVEVRGMFGDGIYVHDADGVLIDHAVVDSCAEGMLLFVGSNGRVRNSIIGHMIDQDGIEMSAWSTGEVSSNQFTSNVWNSNDAIDIFDHCSDIKVLNNYVKPSTSSSATGSIIVHQGNNRVRVSGNTTGTMLLAQTDATTAESNIEYDHNTIINTSTNYGLLINRDSLSGLGYWNFHHNTIYSNNGIYLRGKGTGVSISDNELYPITTGSGVGISLDQITTYRPNNVTITDNKFHGQNYGIWYLFTSSLDTAAITGNHFYNINTNTRIKNENGATISSNVTQYGNDGATNDVLRHVIANAVHTDTAQVGEYTINSVGSATRTVGSTTTNVVDAQVQRTDLITNGSFSGSLTPWSQSSGSAWSYGSNDAVYDESDNAYLSQTTADTIRPTITYRLTFTISSCTDSAQITFSTGITFMKSQSWYKNGTYTIFFTNNSGTEIRIAPNTTTASSAFHIDDVSLIPMAANEGDILLSVNGLWENHNPSDYPWPFMVVTTDEMNNINDPVDGMTVFNSDSAALATYFSGDWRIGTSGGGGGGGSGEINDGVNLGGGLGVYDSKSSVHLNFNTFSSTFFDLTSNIFTPKNGALTLGKMADVATGTVFYRKTAGTGSPEVQTLATLKTDLGLTGTNSGDQTITLTGPITGSGTSTIATSITDGQVALSKLPNASQFTFLGRIAAGSGARADITSAQLLSTITPTSSGFWHITSGGSDAAARAVNVASSDITGVVPIVNGGTNSSTALTGNKAMISNGSGAIVEHSTTTSTEIGYVAGVTSAIQTQLNGKQPLDGDLTAIAALSTNGLVARVASDTYAPRTLIGNTEAVVANGDGIAGNPTLTIGAPIARRSDFADSGMTVVAVPAHYMYAKNADTVTTGQLFDSVSVTGIDVANTTTAFRVRQTSSGKIAEYLSGTTRVFEILTNGHVGVAGTTIYEGSGENLTNITANSVDSVHHIYLDTTGIAAFAAKNLKCGFVYDAASGTFKMQFIPSMADTDNVGRGNVVYYYNGQFHTAPDSLGAGLTVPLPIASGGTNSTAALNSNRFMVSVAGAIIEASAIPANRVIVSDANGLPTGAAAITAARALKSDANGIPVHFDTATEPSMTELTYVKGVTSAIQTQLDAKQATLPSFYMMTQLPAGIFTNAAGDFTGATAIASDADNTNDWTMREIEFSADAQNYISTSLTMPEDWDGSTAPKFKIISYSTGSHASTVARWGIAVGYSRLGTDSWVAALGTEVYATQTYTATYTPQATDIAPTPAGTAGTRCSLKIRLMRDGNNAADTFTSTTRFVRLLMQYKQNSSHGTTSSW